MKKKKVLLQTDFALGKTGFGRNAKAILTYLYKTGKYDLVHYCCGTPHTSLQHKMLPWASVGSLPDDKGELARINQDPNLAKRASYGEYYLDKVIKEHKPDVYIAAQDIWGIDFAINKPWYKKIHSVLWTTLDSLPILPSALDAAKKTDNFWVWSNFAEKEMKKIGFDHVRTVHGAVESKTFKRLSERDRLTLRAVQGVPTDDFIVGFVFRNQLRKSVPNLLEGFKLFKEKNRGVKAKLLLHTHYGEGWNIPKLAREYNISDEEILTTYVCKACNKYSIQSFRGQEVNCNFCKAEKSCNTTNVGHGVTETQLNEIYNFMDVYCHPFTSGGQEIPIQEAKMTELITLVTNYSCGEEMCEPEAASLPLNWSEYREHGTEFIKASTKPNSICNQLTKVLKMKPKQKELMGKQARQWALDNFSTEAVCKVLEDFIDNAEEVNYDFEFEQRKGNPDYVMPEIKSDSEWILHMYKNILNYENVDENDDGFKHWMKEIEKGAPREKIEAYFKQVAKQEQTQSIKFEDTLDKDDKGRRILYCMPKSAGDIFLSTSLFKSIKETYPDHNLYVATEPQFAELLKGNEYVHKVIPFAEQFESHYFTEGAGENEGFFEISFIPHITTQKFQSYQHNGKDIINYKDLKYAHH